MERFRLETVVGSRWANKYLRKVREPVGASDHEPITNLYFPERPDGIQKKLK